MSKILLVEDEMIEQRLLDSVLSSKHNVVCANDGAEAFKILEKQNDFDLIISDINMNKMNGIQLKTVINYDKNLKKIPFMFLTNVKNDHVENECLKLGADLYIHKPFVKFDILKEVNKILDIKFSSLER